MDAVLCPSLLFIEDSDWKNKEKRDLFLNNLNKVFDYIIKYNISIYWNDELECTLWEQPNLHPWLTQDTTSITLLLYNCINNIQSSCGYSKCNCEPEIIGNVYSKDVISPTLSLIHYLIDKKEEISFIVDKDNNHTFVFDCNCHQNILIPEILCVFSETVSISNEVSLRWNKIKDDFSIFTNLLEIVRKKYFQDKNFIYKPMYNASFIRSIYKTTDKKERILYDITHRLILYPIEASQIQGFNDESINGIDKNKRSFRVNDVCRVYYEYQKDNIMLFTNYTSSSEHDKGTRHT